MHRFERCQSTKSIWEEPERGTFFGTTLRSTQQPMRWISWAASLCLPLPVDNYYSDSISINTMSLSLSPLSRMTFLPYKNLQIVCQTRAIIQCVTGSGSGCQTSRIYRIWVFFKGILLKSTVFSVNHSFERFWSGLTVWYSLKTMDFSLQYGF